MLVNGRQLKGGPGSVRRCHWQWLFGIICNEELHYVHMRVGLAARASQ